MASRIAIDLAFDGVPVNVNVALHSRVKKQRNDSFKTIAPSGFPMRSGDPVDTHTDKPYDKALNRKGVEIPGQKGAYAVLTPEAVEQINSGVKTTVAKAQQYVPRVEVDFALAIDRFSVVPDDKVPGSEQAVQVLFSGLHGNDLALVTQISPSGGMDGVLVVYAAGTRLWGALLPFEAELYPTPDVQFEVNSKAVKAFRKLTKVQTFNHGKFTSEYKTRRKTVIDQVLAGVEVEAPVQEAPKDDTPDLMAALLEAAEVEA